MMRTVRLRNDPYHRQTRSVICTASVRSYRRTWVARQAFLVVAKGTAQMIPGWPYSVVAALGSGRSSWTAVLDAVRVGPADDTTAVTAAQLREVVDRLRQAGHWFPGDPLVWIVLDSGYDVCRLAFLLADLPVVLVGRLRSDRVLARPVQPRLPGGRGRPAATAPCRPRPPPPPPRPPGGGGPPAATARCWSWPTRPPGPPPSTPAAPTPPATAPRR